MTMNQNAREIADEIFRWASKNFTYQDSIGEGMAEEIGEFCHHKLKFKQKIRGHSSLGDDINRKRQLDFDLKDALGDAMVYCLHWCSLHDTFISFDTADRFATVASDLTENELIGHIFQILSRIFFVSNSRHVHEDEYRGMGQRFLDHIAALAKGRGWEYKKILQDTWDEVKKRDWIKYPKTGLPDE